MSLMRGSDRIAHLSFPRVSGDEPFAEVKALADKWFSPRERG